jgi:hypothetical protein
MLIEETIRKIQLSIYRDDKSIPQTAKDLRVSRNTVRMAVRTQQIAFEYGCRCQPRPALGSFVERPEGGDPGKGKDASETAHNKNGLMEYWNTGIMGFNAFVF